MLNNQNLWEKHSEQKEQQIKMSQETNGSGMFQVENSTPLEYSENGKSTVSDKHTEQIVQGGAKELLQLLVCNIIQ